MSSSRRIGRAARALLFGFGFAAVLGLGACATKESEPVAVARAFAETARRGDVAGMLAVIELPAVERLTDAAETASDQVGGRRSIPPTEMLQIVGVDRTVAVASAELIDETDELAHVELTMTDGQRVRLELVWEPAMEAVGEPVGANQTRTAGWKVRIPIPAAGGSRVALPDA